MGSETSFLRRLEEAGSAMVFCPRATVEHRIKRHDCLLGTVMSRARSYGRGRVYIDGIENAELLEKRPWQWRAWQLRRLVIGYARLAAGYVCNRKMRRVQYLINRQAEISRIRESLLLTN